MLGAIGSGLRRLAVFSGRDGRRVFWPYALFVVALAFAAGGVLILPEFAAAFARLQRFAAEHPDQATVRLSPGGYSIQIHGSHPELLPSFDRFFTGMWISAAVTVILLAAAVARRLHDTGRGGAWGLLPLPFIVGALAGFPTLMASVQAGQPRLGLAFALVLNNLLYLGSLALLGVFLAGPGARTGNRFGPPD